MNKLIKRLSVIASLFSIVFFCSTLVELLKNNFSDLLLIIIRIIYYCLCSIFTICTLKEYSIREDNTEKIVNYIKEIKSGNFDKSSNKYYENVCDIILNEYNKKHK